MRYTHVIWDWNGTLLDDVQWCVDCENRILDRHGMPRLSGVAAYHQLFCFPVRQYYLNLGYDFEKNTFEALSQEYIDLYQSDCTGGCGIFPDAHGVLQAFQRAGLHQVVLSASKRDHLIDQVIHAGIEAFFDELLGLTDIYAHSKVQIGLDYLGRGAVGRAVLIGDTTHDYEVAAALGADCVLVARGHQSEARLRETGAPVVQTLAAAGAMILNDCGRWTERG